jgi:hypothetical protein
MTLPPKRHPLLLSNRQKLLNLILVRNAKQPLNNLQIAKLRALQSNQVEKFFL